MPDDFDTRLETTNYLRELILYLVSIRHFVKNANKEDEN